MMRLEIYDPTGCVNPKIFPCGVLIRGRWRYKGVTMTSSNGNIFRVTGHLCGNSPVTGEFPAQRPVTPSFDVLFDLRLNKRLSKQLWGWWFETPSHPLWRQSNVELCDRCEFYSIWVAVLPDFSNDKILIFATQIHARTYQSQRYK